MSTKLTTHWIIAIISLAVFILTFFIFFRDTYETFSSLVAAILSSLLTLGALIVMSWFTQVFKK